MTITVDQLRAWSEQLATQPPIELAAAVAALGLTGSLVAKSSDYAVVEPPPPGATRLALSREGHGDNKTKLGSVEITLDGKAITRGELDRKFGDGNVHARVDYNRPYVVGYRVEIAGAPYRCAVLASFGEQPTAASVATKVMLRRDAVSAP